MIRVPVEAGKNTRSATENRKETSMLSTCPSCLSQVNHPDHLFDVTCECGAHFSPYLNIDDPKPNSFSEYAESNSAFKEIVQFGEKLGSDIDTPMEPSMDKIIEEKTPTPPPMPAAEGTKSFGAAREMLISTTSELSGHVIQTHYMPVSLVVPFQATSSNPIQQGVLGLWKMAEGVGANGLVGLQTTITPDGQNLLLVGVPIRCSKVV